MPEPQDGDDFITEGLRTAGYDATDATHVRDLDLQTADDGTIFAIFEVAVNEDRIVGSADTDFGTLLALREFVAPPVILFPPYEGSQHPEVGRGPLANLDAMGTELRAGAIIEPSWLRVRRLPIEAMSWRRIDPDDFAVSAGNRLLPLGSQESRAVFQIL